MELKRSAGILLHVSSLPGRYGIGDLGREAYQFVDWLASAKQSWWQMLPLGPVGDTNCPYSSPSSSAASPLFISLDKLVEAGDLSREEIRIAKQPQSSYVNYRAVKAARKKLFPIAARRFFDKAKKRDVERFKKFCHTERSWLNDWSLFTVLSSYFKKDPWWRWPKDIRAYQPDAIKFYQKELRDSIQIEKYLQFRFFEQWQDLRRYAKRSGIKLIGDVPIYCAGDSVDVWSAQDMFKLTNRGTPKAVSGVPPDCFSTDGQLWGTPVYNWPKHKATGFKWWIARLKGCLKTVDLVRLDHFIGLQNYWEVPAKAKTARNGKWVKGPGDSFLAAIYKKLGKAPLIAEDLGLVTPAVAKLRDDWKLPGMHLTHFAFDGGPDNPNLPFNNAKHSVVYTGTHDNDTTQGWYAKLAKAERDFLHALTGVKSKKRVKNIHWDLIRLTYSSCAKMAIIPMQDVLGLSGKNRMNYPSRAKGQWRWRLTTRQLAAKNPHVRLSELTKIYGRELR